MDNIFEPFYSSKEIGEGTGLGLSICKKIIDEHHGLIKVESTLGKGTSFKMLLPVPDREDDDRTRCWEFQNCGADRTEGGSIFRCPAYPEYGRVCWAVAGTFCKGKIQGKFALETFSCVICDVFSKVKREECTETFTLLKASQPYSTSHK